MIYSRDTPFWSEILVMIPKHEHAHLKNTKMMLDETLSRILRRSRAKVKWWACGGMAWWISEVLMLSAPPPAVTTIKSSHINLNGSFSETVYCFCDMMYIALYWLLKIAKNTCWTKSTCAHDPVIMKSVTEHHSAKYYKLQRNWMTYFGEKTVRM